MDRLHNTSLKRRKIKPMVRRIVALLLIVYIAYTLVFQQIAINEARTKEEEIKKQIEALKKENEQIKAELERMSDQEYIEKLAREKLGLIKPGEIMFIDVNYKDQNKDN